LGAILGHQVNPIAMNSKVSNEWHLGVVETKNAIIDLEIWLFLVDNLVIGLMLSRLFDKNVSI